jgi:putative endonuclease
LALVYRCSDWLRERADRNLGKAGEDRAHRWLRRHGFIVAARNWRPPQGGGEIDIVAWEGAELVFVEVKTRREDALSAPERAMGVEKIDALRRAARDYVRRSGADPAQVRFDVIAVEGVTIDHLRGAFSP